MKAYEVTEGFDAVYCATEDDVRLVTNEMNRRNAVIGIRSAVKVEEVEIREMLPADLAYIVRLREAEHPPHVCHYCGEPLEDDGADYHPWCSESIYLESQDMGYGGEL